MAAVTSIQLGASPVIVNPEPSYQVCVGAYFLIATCTRVLWFTSKAVPETAGRERMPPPLASTGIVMRAEGCVLSMVTTLPIPAGILASAGSPVLGPYSRFSARS